MITSLRIPQEPFLLRLFQLWQKAPEATLIRDRTDDGKDFTISHFLYDVLTVQLSLYKALDNDCKNRLRNPDADVFVGVLARGGYSFSVLLFAIYALGAVAVPLSPDLHPEEAKYYMEVCNTTLLATVPAATAKATVLSDISGIKTFVFDATQSTISDQPKFHLDTQSPLIEPEKGYLVLYTSGSTGPPKGVLHSRRAAWEGFRADIKGLGLSARDMFIHFSPVQWMGGCMLLHACILSGACIEMRSTTFTTDWLLARIQEGDITSMYLPPEQLSVLRDRINAGQTEGSHSTYEVTLRAIRDLRLLISGSMLVSPSLRDDWKIIRNGKPITVAYGTTETVALISVTNDEESPLDSCGRCLDRVCVRVDSSGEICVKTPALFTRYISPNPDVMDGVFDSEGYFRTGDLGKIENGNIYIFGRASQDAIRSNGLKFYAPEIEAELCTHPLISQAIVLGVPDPLIGERVAALVVTTEHAQLLQDRHGTDGSLDEISRTNLNLFGIRKWLAIDRELRAFKLPTMLRVVGPAYELPKTISNKPVKSKIRKLIFNNKVDSSNGEVEVWDFTTKESNGIGDRPFDWP